MTNSDNKFQEDILSDYRKRVSIALEALTKIINRKPGELPLPEAIARRAIVDMADITAARTKTVGGQTHRGTEQQKGSRVDAKDVPEYLRGGILGDS
jgi:hypothetical protein